GGWRRGEFGEEVGGGPRGLGGAPLPPPPPAPPPRHTHDTHQLAWAARGVLIVATDAGTWVLPPARALWIPAGVEHETIASATTTMRSLYFSRHMCPITWSRPQPVAANPLFAELIGYLARSDLGDERRER